MELRQVLALAVNGEGHRDLATGSVDGIEEHVKAVSVAHGAVIQESKRLAR